MRLKALSPLRLEPGKTIDVGAEFDVENDADAQDLVNCGAAEKVLVADAPAEKPAEKTGGKKS